MYFIRFQPIKANFTPPPDMVFGEAQILSISVYVILFIIGLVFNSLSLKQLLEERIKRKVKSKMNLLLIHLAIADLMVREYTKMLQMSPKCSSHR